MESYPFGHKALPVGPPFREDRRHRILSEIGQRDNGSAIVLGDIGSRGIIQLSAENADAPENLTITLYRNYIRALTAAEENQVNGAYTAKIQWGAGKVFQTLECDFHHGTRLTLDASSLEIEAILSTVDDAAFRGPDVRFSASIVYGNIGSRNLSFTTRTALGAGSSTILPVPQFAGSVTPYGGGSVAATIRWLANRALPLGDPSTFADNVKLPIPNGAEFYTLENVDASAHVYSLIWGLNV